MASTTMECQELTIEQLKDLFQSFDMNKNKARYKLTFPEGMFRNASVLIPIFYKDGYRVLLTVRSKEMRTHAGFVAFPGGVKDGDDKDDVDTALREANEEIGLDPQSVQVIGVFTPSVVSPNTMVVPVIGLIPADFIPKINEQEVSMVFDLPLERFLTQDRLTVKQFHSSSGAVVYNMHHFVDTVNDGQREITVDTFGFTAKLCVFTALGIFQTNQEFCFYNDVKVNRFNLFSEEETVDITDRALKGGSKL